MVAAEGRAIPTSSATGMGAAACASWESALIALVHTLVMGGEGDNVRTDAIMQISPASSRPPFLHGGPRPRCSGVHTPFRTTRPIGQHFRKTADQSHMSRRIINISSITGYMGGFNQAAYGAGKAAIISLSSTWANELAPFHLRSNCI
jgi:NAD(P)-dependent dehydrogenase (short-subunit alcohol dehydrogenase family)